MTKLNQDGTVDLNEFVREVTLEEKGAKEVDIGQTKQIAKIIAKKLVGLKHERGTATMVETVKRLAE